MSQTTLALPMFQVYIEKYIHPNSDEAKASKKHSLTVRVKVKDDDLKNDLNSLFDRQTYGLHLYRRSRYSWLPIWREDWISVMDKVDLETFVLGTTKTNAFAYSASKKAKYNIGEFTSLNPATFEFFTEKELCKAEPLIEKAIKRFLNKVISRGPYPDSYEYFIWKYK